MNEAPRKGARWVRLKKMIPLPSQRHTSTQEPIEQQGYSIGHVDVRDAARAHIGDNHITNHYYAASQLQPDIYETLLASLTFDRMDARLHNVAMALPTSCDWLLHHPDFLAWTDDGRAQEHAGFLWIKGKPGSGKSTVMKETLIWAERTWSDQIILSYFFNARSSHLLEKSSLGLYRSLLYQLLHLLPSARPLFATKFASKIRNNEVECWWEVELQNFLIQLVTTLQMPVTVIFIDALDEGADDDVRQMVRFLERLMQHTIHTTCPLRVCLSSRHYPHISVPRSLSLNVEDQAGHGRDIELYIRSQLPGGDSLSMDYLRQMVRDRSAGVFLWVVLVIQILTKAYDQGRDTNAMLRKLTTIPPDLHNMFAQLLFKESDDFDECVTMLQWVLFAKRPLSPIELYHAVQCSSFQTGADGPPVVAPDVATRYLLNCSRGLVELTKTKDPIVQFIHETVRDYLRSGRLFEQGESRVAPSNVSQQTFKAEVCHGRLSEISLTCMLRGFDRSPSAEKVTSHHSLARYATQFWWQHLRTGLSPPIGAEVNMALGLLTGDRNHLLRWIRLYDPDVVYPDTVDRLAPSLFYAACIGRQELVAGMFAAGADVNARGGYHSTALIAASARGHEKIVQTLLDCGADINAQGRYGFTALFEATQNGHEKVVQMLLDRGANPNHRAQHRTTLHLASEYGYANVAQILLDRGAAINALEWQVNALQVSSAYGHKNVVQILLKRGADIEACKGRHGSPLYEASSQGYEEIVQMLLDEGADVDARRGEYGGALHVASLNGRENTVRMLLDHGADINDHGNYIGTALHAASLKGHGNIVQMLLDRGADVNAQGCGGWFLSNNSAISTALGVASFKNHEHIVQILLERGARPIESL